MVIKLFLGFAPAGKRRTAIDRGRFPAVLGCACRKVQKALPEPTLLNLSKFAATLSCHDAEADDAAEVAELLAGEPDHAELFMV